MPVGRPENAFVFLVGTNGSGTTLHQAIFDSHPDLAIVGRESRFIVRLGKKREIYSRTGGFDGALFHEDLQKDERFLRWGLDQDDVAAALADPSVEDFSAAVRSLYRLYAQSRGKTRYGDKTQAYVHDVPLLASLFPEARFVHVVRDGRDVALAHAEGSKMEQIGMSWRRRVRSGRRAGRALGPKRYIESRFEDLMEDPESAVRRLCDFLDLEFHPRMLTYYERADEIVATGPDRHRDISLPPTKGLRDWKRELSKDQVMRFEAIAGDLLDELGYGRAFGAVPIWRRFAAWLAVASDSARLFARKLRRGD